MSDKKKYGIVAIIGRPNTGKSTLLNAILQQKVAITSPLPQTTRKNINAVYEDERGKILFIDTPGVLGKVEDLIGKKVNLELPKTLSNIDVLVVVVDISRPKNEEENKVIALVRKSEAKKILVYNKIYKAVGSKDHFVDYNYLEDEFDEWVKISALKEKGVKEVVNKIFSLLPAKVVKDSKTVIDSLQQVDRPIIDSSPEEYVAELIREKVYLFLRDEIPYSIQVVVKEIKDKGKIIIIEADIVTTTDRYKKIIIGRGGKKIKEIGYNARKELELMTQKKIFLELEVKVDKHWMEQF